MSYTFHYNLFYKPCEFDDDDDEKDYFKSSPEEKMWRFGPS